MKKLVLLMFFLVLIGSGKVSHAQTHALVAPVSPGNVNQCPTANQYPVVYTYQAPLLTTQTGQNHFGTVQGGYCQFQVGWGALAFPSSGYAVSCTPENGNAAGYIYNIAIDQKTGAGFRATVSYYLHNDDNNDRRFAPSDIGTIFIDCVGSNQ